METKEATRYMELQMAELKASLNEGIQEEDSPPPKKKNTAFNEKNAAIAKLYEDAAEYEEDLACFEKELAIVKTNNFKDIASLLTQELPDEERDYAQEINTVLQAGWTHLVEIEKTHPKAQLELIKATDFAEVVQILNTNYPDYTGDFEKEIRDILLKRWEMLVGIKKEHIKEEHAELKIAGLKPKYVKRVYQQFNGLI